MENGLFYSPNYWNSKLNRENNEFIKTIIYATLTTTNKYAKECLTGNLPADAEIIRNNILDGLDACNFMLSDNSTGAVIQESLYSFTISEGARESILNMVETNICNPALIRSVEGKIAEMRREPVRHIQYPTI